jgi:hypothetical protein
MSDMNLLNLREDQMLKIIEGLDLIGSRETARWCFQQYTEQKKGGAWKRRLREQGHVI